MIRRPNNAAPAQEHHVQRNGTQRITTSELPKTIGKYKIKGLVAEGGTGTVYVAHDPFGDRRVALKVCHIPEDTHSEVRRLIHKIFYNEADCARRLRHPNIVQTYDAGEEQGEPYIVMEYVEGGENLKSHTSSENLLPVKTVVKILYQCAKALDYAHSKGVIHRDIKPANIMLTGSGEVKITDFGVAYSANSSITQFTGLLGTPRYMSPEQIREERLTSQTDLYSLGIVGFEILTGQTPFAGKNIPEIVRRSLNEPPPPLRQLRPRLPARLEEIIVQLIEKEVEKRYDSGQALAADLVALFGELSEADAICDTVKDLTFTKKFKIARELEFFKEFSDSELSEAVRACHWQLYQAGEAIVREGAEDYAIYILADGEVEVSIMDKPIGVLSKGTCFGEMNYLSKTKRTATVTAKQDIYVLRTDATMLKQIPAQYQLRFNEALVKVLLERLARTSDRLVDFVQ